jgi:site-specific recombinase XerD
MGIRLTDKIVDGLPKPAAGYKIYWDAADKHGRDWIGGFGVRLTAAGHRSFIFRKRTKAGRDRTLTIGSPPAWSVAAARAEAKELDLRVDRGEDVQGQRKALRDAETVGHLCDAFIKDHLPGKRTEDDYRATIEWVRDELGTHKVAAVTKLDLQRLHKKITDRGKRGKRGSPIRANRVISAARAMFNFAIEQHWRTDNPAVGIKPNRETKRERYLEPSELARLMAALDQYHDQSVADRFRLALLTGCRIGETYALWTEFSDDFDRWTKPASRVKTQRDHVIPLNTAARQLLTRISRTSKTNTVFRPIDYSNLRRHWVNICRAANVRNLKIHDLRHSFASTLINQDVPLPTIGKLLGHSSVATTELYSHLVHDTLREATELAGKALSGGLTIVRGGRR